MRTIALLIAAATLTAPVLATAQTPPAAPASAAAASGKYTTEETDIATLLADPAAKAVLVKHIPDVVNNEQISMAAAMTLRAVQVYAPDQLPDDKLTAIDKDLAKLPAKK